MSKLTISQHISTEWRSYAEYVIYNRGIPSFYDGMTNVQRVLLDNAPTSHTKSIAVVGSAIKSGYHHGNASLENALNGMAKDFNCSEPLLNGEGFFGSPVSDEAAAARYTAVKISSNIKKLVDEFSVLNTKNEEGSPMCYT